MKYGVRAGIMTVAAFSGLTACVLNIEVEATFENGLLVFGSDMRGDRQWSLDSFEVSDRSTGKPVWQFERDGMETSQFSDSDFPIRYGELPRGMKLIVPASRLVSGRVYDISGSTGNNLRGAFRYTVIQRVDNVAPSAWRPLE